MRTNRFHGGIKLAADTWSPPADVSRIVRMPPPSTLRLPLADTTGYCAQPIVTVGEKVLAGQPLTRTDEQLCPPILASCAGTVTVVDDVNQALLASREKSPCIEISVCRDNPDVRWSTDSADIPAQHKVHLSGLRGLGGAAFPTSRKWRIAESPVRTLIINAAECEPLISCDEALIHERADELIEAIEFLHRTLQSEQCLVGIEADKHSAIARLTEASQSSGNPSFAIAPIEARYPAGAERQLIKILTDLEVPYQQRPASIGVRCFNIATTLALKQLLVDNIAPTSRIVTVAGSAIKTPVNVSVKFGTSLAELASFVDADLPGDVEYVRGGPVSGITLPDLSGSVSASTNCLLVNHSVAKPESQPCIRCGHCDDVCPQSLLPQQLHWYCSADKLEDANRFRLDACIECGCCDLVCPSQLPLTEQFRNAKRTQATLERAARLASEAKVRFEKRERRLQRREALRQQRLAERKAEIDARRAANPKEAIAAALARSRKRKRTGPGDAESQ